MPACEVVGILEDDVVAEVPAVGVEVQLEVAVLAHQFGRIEGSTQRESKITHTHAERRFVVGCYLRVEFLSARHTHGLQLRTRNVESRCEGPLGLRSCDVRRVDVALEVAYGQHTIHPMVQPMCLFLRNGLLESQRS